MSMDGSKICRPRPASTTTWLTAVALILSSYSTRVRVPVDLEWIRYRTYSGDDQQVIAYHELAPMHKPIHNSPYQKRGTDDHESPRWYEDFDSFIWPVLLS